MGKANAERRKIEVKEQGGLAKEIMGVILIVVGILFGICVFSDSQTVLLKALRSFAFGVNGVLGYALPFIFAAAGLLSIFSQKLKIKAGTVVLGILGLVSLFSLVHLLGPYGQEVENGFGAYIEKAYVNGSENI